VDGREGMEKVQGPRKIEGKGYYGVSSGSSSSAFVRKLWVAI
jgi:hypothetical protein